MEFVDPTIGNVSILLAPTQPAVYLPNSMVRIYPLHSDALDDRIEAFPLAISSHREGELFTIMPGDGTPAAYDQQVATPYFYSARFRESKSTTEFTVTERCGYFRFTFPSGDASLVLSNRVAGDVSLHDGNIVEGEEKFNNMKAYVYGVFSKTVAFTSSATSESAEHARAAATALLRLYNPRTGLFNTTGWWNSANAVTALADESRGNGDPSPRALFPQVFAKAPAKYRRWFSKTGMINANGLVNDGLDGSAGNAGAQASALDALNALIP